MIPDPLPVALPELLAPFDWCYEWDGPFGTRKFSTAPHNGRRYDRSVALFTADQMRDYATQSVSAALSARAGKLPELPTVAWADDDDLLEERPELCAIQDSRRHTNMRYDVALVRKSDAEAALRAQAEEVAALRAAIDKIRQSVSPKGPRPCDCERCDCHNSGSWAQVVAWDEAASMVAAIDVHLAASKQEKPHG